ncbi:MAG: hypothetical protein RBU30_26035 [Polyangia bacterium]|jgi:membrane-bound ClpP family serine protease|nr:hypothetical protein [Polyangia bacterium]
MLHPVFALTIDHESAYWVLAIAGSVLFVIKVLLVLFGGDAGGGDADGAGHADSTGVFAIFSLQSVLAFFMGAGWMGLACIKEWETSKLTAFFSAIGFGLTMMALNTGIMFAINKLNAEPKVDLREAIGHLARVYLVIPARGEGTGQVEVTVSDRRQIYRAVSEEGEIPSETLVKVIDVRDGQIMVVRPQDQERA